MCVSVSKFTDTDLKTDNADNGTVTVIDQTDNIFESVTIDEAYKTF